MNLHNKRIGENKCTRCGTPHVESWTKRKCKPCADNESVYRKHTRGNRREQEREYRIKNWANRCVYLSRGSDIRKHREVGENYITAKRLKTLRVLQINKCFYCMVDMTTANRKHKTGLTTERLDNSKPHDENNVVLCCSSCNCRKLSNKHNIQWADAYRTILTRLEDCPAWETLVEQLGKLVITPSPN
jgi:hypothetical protein